ncbi:hypothetical protein GCG54_00004210 [Colletotrichum gloeosporioides]|uniref:Uncharacterized protein n=1 Tax=Colletotrichum gloeosporioides TaxID=474922 RepID=A0A8H4CJ51_COLGL|nr:uncharacterized protein GCG54_00004210 [Colletotrichum gloeosporioides]KAF3804940.1 hypothetical protein GCG54_00004210 [Colletotrichum gloeosporioides]
MLHLRVHLNRINIQRTLDFSIRRVSTLSARLMFHRQLNLVLDFDGTITTKDTIGTIAEVGLHFQRQRGLDLSAAWRQILEDYNRDHIDHVSAYKPAADGRLTLSEELSYLRGLREVELRSVRRVERSGIFKDISRGELVKAGDAARQEGRVKLRDGFAKLMDTAKQNNWPVSVVSINWSRSFIQGVLSAYEFDVVANEIEIDGSISGPEVLGPLGRETILTTCEDKLRALRALAARQGVDNAKELVYFGDSTSDLECLLETRGVVVTSTPESTLMTTLTRLGYDVPRVQDCREVDKIHIVQFRGLRETAIMCYYRLAIYEYFLYGKRALECTTKKAHSLQTLRLDSDCEKCRKLDELQLRTKQALKELREGREGPRDTTGSSMQDSLVESSDDVTSDLGSSGAPTSDDTADISHDV